MRLELKEFAKAARSMHQQPGGIKRTRLTLHLRPYKTRKIFLLKATDGRTTLTTRVEHQGQIKLVEALVGDFVTECTRLSVPVAASNTSAAGAQAPSTATAANTSATPSSAAAAAATSTQKESPALSQKAAASGSGNSAASNAQQQQQQHAQKSGKPAGKGKKGKKH